MGSWFETCALTNMPITDGQKCRVIFIRQNHIKPDGSNSCYASDLWKPISPAFKATYDDYGNFKFDINPLEADFFLNYIKENLVEVEEGKNKIHDIPVKKEKITFELILDAILEGRLKINHKLYDWENLNEDGMKKADVINASVGRIAIHEFAYQTLGKIHYPETYPWVIYHGDQVQKQVDAFKDHIEKLDMDVFKDAEWLLEETLVDHTNILSTVLSKGRESGAELRYYKDLFIPLFKEDKIELAKEFLKELYDYSVFIINFELMRKQFVPQSGSGSQTQEMESYKLLCQNTLDFIRKDEEEMEEFLKEERENYE